MFCGQDAFREDPWFRDCPLEAGQGTPEPASVQSSSKVNLPPPCRQGGERLPCTEAHVLSRHSPVAMPNFEGTSYESNA